MMDDPERNKIRQQQEVEQGMAMLADAWPRFWWLLYSNLLKEGFSETQSLELVKTYITAKV